MTTPGKANSLTGIVNTAANTFTNIANNASKVVNQAVNQVAPAINSVLPFGTPVAATPNNRKNRANSLGLPSPNAQANTSFANGITNTFTNIANGATNVVNAAANTAANVATNVANGAANIVNTAANAASNVATNAVGAVNTAVNTLAGNTNTSSNLLTNTANLGANAKKEDGFFKWALLIFVVLIVIFITIFSLFSNEIGASYEALVASIRSALGLASTTTVQSQVTPIQGEVKEVTEPPKAPQDVLPDEAVAEQTLVEKILPIGGGNEVFNVAQNKFTFYDAEPLCRALGAELATYEQVREAWSKGADWCNYGWVKGQMAVYPTQKDTYEKLQSGIPEERTSCGTVGLNGGYFDNPELRYGVNCYGKKPPQSTHDQRMLMEQGKIPLSPEALTVDRLAAEFRAQRDTMFIRPFNDGKWSSS